MFLKSQFIKLSINFAVHFSSVNSLLYLRNNFNIVVLKMPFSYFVKLNDYKFSFLFFERKVFLTFLRNFFVFYKNLFIFNFVKLKLKGLGYRVRKYCHSLFRFFFNCVNFFYLHLPSEILLRFKKTRFIAIGSNLVILKLIFAQLLLLKRMSVYRVRGFVSPRRIIFLKIGKKRL